MNDAPVHFIVWGNPKPQGSMKHIGRGRMIHQPDMLDWRFQVTNAARKAMDDRLPLEGAIVADLMFTVPRPKSLPKKVTLPTRRPDIDKLARAVLDGLTQGDLILDDRHVVQLDTSKEHVAAGKSTGVSIVIL